MMGSRNLGIISERKDGWAKRARLGDIDGGDGVKEGPESLLSMSAFVTQYILPEAVSEICS